MKPFARRRSVEADQSPTLEAGARKLVHRIQRGHHIGHSKAPAALPPALLPPPSPGTAGEPRAERPGFALEAREVVGAETQRAHDVEREDEEAAPRQGEHRMRRGAIAAQVEVAKRAQREPRGRAHRANQAQRDARRQLGIEPRGRGQVGEWPEGEQRAP